MILELSLCLITNKTKNLVDSTYKNIKKQYQINKKLLRIMLENSYPGIN